MDAIDVHKDHPEKDTCWTSEVETLLKDWRCRVYASQSAYYSEAERLRRCHYLLGIPVVILSTIVGTSLVTSPDGSPMLPNWIAGGLSGVAAILASLQTFFRFGESAASHGTAADWYAAIRRDIEELLALSLQLRGDVRGRLDTIRKEINKASQKAPELRESLWAVFAERFGVEEPPLIGRRKRNVRPVSE
ncbi:MAG TPA: DUF4231 domain-containing protein [Candidatus Acidoferrum sp.]|nr:DUF4231 domain-containing protein [Candidatus Acidoferrum sp.]